MKITQKEQFFYVVNSFQRFVRIYNMCHCIEISVYQFYSRGGATNFKQFLSRQARLNNDAKPIPNINEIIYLPNLL